LVHVFSKVYDVDFTEDIDFFTVTVDYIAFITEFEYTVNEVKACTVEIESFADVVDVSEFVRFWNVDV
jgi:hypothetical protein